MKKFFSFVLQGIAVMIITTIFTLVAVWGLEKKDKNDCLKWQLWSKEIRKDIFFLSPDQKRQCDSVGIKIDAPIRKVSI